MDDDDFSAMQQGVPDPAPDPVDDKKNKGKKPCFICTKLAMKGKRWCDAHNRIFDCMYYQAKKAQELQLFESVMSKSLTAKQAIETFESENPCDGKWGRKKLICWTQFKKSYVNARTERSRNGSKPFEFKQWVRRCVNEMGWTDAQANSEWDRWEKTNVSRDSNGLNGAMRLWIPIIEESHSDRDRTKLNVIEESSAAEKDLSDADRHILFSHCNSSIDAPKDDFFFQAKDEPVSPSGPEETPQKRKASEAQASGISEVSPQEKRARLKIARVSSGPAFSTFRVSSAEKIQSVVQSKVQVLTLAVSNGTECVKMKEFTEQADDSVLQSYRSMLSHAMEVAQAWLAEPKDLKDPETFSDGLPEGVVSANLAVSTQLESAGAHVKLVQGGASLHSLAYWRWMFKKVMICEEAAVIAEQMDVFKDDMQVFEQFRKGLAKICSDVKSYLTQKDKSKIKEEQKRLKAAQKQEAQVQKAHAKKEA
ncbi:unnamed protein product, partial [Effrenium voratum]